ncbi:PREDICTED: histone-lysine N-methyltransferase ASH1L isoform X2 [Cyprinodon variegatus]|uniref:histone-lysine N-methyltransferase ASH1L isoform X2 n=1 Tax=Cyprinodon variegatus TaxID=28743 RepID=UPI000742A7B3|nr:PREDICTED: histone-lysine N-methyltransferase ASH1L isoform X2 [Cyprinodon variegatus]
MDQRVKGGTPPTTASILDSTSAPEDSKQDQVAEKKKRSDGDSSNVGKKEEEKRGAGGKREGDKGAVLELLIEGRCGGQQDLQLAGRESNCPEGNVRVRIGLQAKRTKKPPKILESYVCKPTIRTYQRQGRGALLRADGEGRAVQQNKSSPATDEANREPRSGLDAVQTTSKKTASATSLPVTKSISSSSLQPLSLASTITSECIPASGPNISSHGTKTGKQVPIKLADKTDDNSNGSSERVKKDKLPCVNGQSVPAGQKPRSPTADQTVSTTPSTPSKQTVSTSETRNEGNSSKKHNGLVQTAKQKELSNGRSSSNILGTPASSKNKAGKHSGSSSTSSSDSTARPVVSFGSHKDLSSKPKLDSPSCVQVTPKSQSPPSVDSSSVLSVGPDPSPQALIENKREKEKKAKKEKRKDKKSKKDRSEGDKEKSEKRKDEIKKKKKEKDGKLRHDKEKDEKHKTDELWKDKLKNETGKGDKQSPDKSRTEDNAKCGETVGIPKLDKICKKVAPVRLEEKEKAADSCRLAKQGESATTGDYSKSKEQDVTRHTAGPPPLSTSSAPPPLPPSSSHIPVSPPSSPREQDSRPLKKRKARRPSWTKLVHRAHRAENQEASLDSLHNASLNFPQITKTSFPAKTTVHHNDESQSAPSSSLSSCSSPMSSAVPKQTQPMTDSVRKRGRPKSHSSSLDEPPPRLSPNDISSEDPSVGCDRAKKAPMLVPILQSNSSPKKRGRPPKRPLPGDQGEDALNPHSRMERSEEFHLPERGNRQLKIRKLINEMKRRKKRRLHKVIMSGYVGKEGRGKEAADGKTSLRMCKSIEATTVHTLSALSSSFGSKLGPQINVSKRGTIYMGKRRGRKPKSQTAILNSSSQNSSHSSLFTSPPEASLFSSSQPQLPQSHPFPSPSLTHSSGAQSPYSEGSLTEPTSSLLFSHHFSLPSPSSSCTSPRPPSSSSLSPFVKKSCPCQGRHQFPFHQSSCKLSGATPPMHHVPGSPSHLKEATPSPRSESHSDETLPSDSGIGTDNNSVSERGEMRGARGILRMGQGSGVILGGQRLPTSLVDHQSSVSSALSHVPRNSNTTSTSNAAERLRDRHRRRDYDCPSSCPCLCTCLGHNKCIHSEYYSCLGHSALKRQKNKHKKKHQQMHMQDPEFLAELEDLIAQFNEVHIGRRSWARTGLGQGFDGGRRHHSSSHSHRSNIFRINLNGFYTPHPPSFPAAPSFNPQPFYACHCNRKLDRRQCSCPSKFQETIDNMGFYGSYPPAPPSLYHHLPSSFPLPPPHQYTPHQSHHAHFLLNPARFHRRRSRLLREGALGGEVEGDPGASSRGVGSGFVSGVSCGWGRTEHKHKHRHRHYERNMETEEELQDEEDEDGIDRELLGGAKTQSGFLFRQVEGRRKEGSTLSKDSPWLRQNGSIPFSSATSSSSSSSAERYKNTSLTSLGLGSTHLSSFGGGWGGLGQTWGTFGSLGSAGFGTLNPSWRGFTGDKHVGRQAASEEEDEDCEDDVNESHFYVSKHTNLFTSAAMSAAGRGLRSGLASRNPGSGEKSWSRDEPAWTEMREAGLQGDLRNWGQRTSMPTPHCAVVKNKRGPGRPRKHPLPSPSHAKLAMPLGDLVPEAEGEAEEVVPEKRGGGGNTAQQVMDLVSQASRKRGRKRKHGDSPCHQSFAKDIPECDTHSEFLSQSDVDEAPPQPVALHREESRDGSPVKNYLRAGLYSDDYKTTDPPFRAQTCSESLEYTPGDLEYSLLPAPIHVGKYLRLKRIHFQLPYDVMWQWQHNQLQRQPAVPLKRKRRYCRLKQRTPSSQPTMEESSRDITSLFPHLDMEPLTCSERSFVVKHNVFLVRNWELVRDRQIRMRIERGRDGGEEGEDSQILSCDGSSGDDSHIKSDHSVGVEVTVISSSDPHHQSQDTPSSLTASPSPTNRRSRQEEEEEEEEAKRGERDVCSREQRRKRLNDLLLTLQHS